MPDYIKYRFCPNVTCDNHINKKKFKSGAEVCVECGFSLKDYDFDPVTRQILNYDDDTDTCQTEQPQETIETPSAEEPPIDFGSIPNDEKPPFDLSGDTITEPTSSPTPNASAVDKEKEELKRQLQQMAMQMAKMQEMLNNQEPKPAPSTPTPKPVESVKPVVPVSPPQTEGKQAEKPVSETPKAEHTVHIPIMTPEEEEKKRKEIQQEVAKEFELKRIKEEREKQRAEFEKAYNEKRKAEQKLIQEERERQEKLLAEKEHAETKDVIKPEKTLDLNADGFYNSNEPLHEELYKKSKKKTIYQIVSLGLLIFVILYAVLYITQ